MPDSPPQLELQPMIHVESMPDSIAFYEALGATLEHGSRDGDFAMLTMGASRFSLLAHPPNPEQDEGTVEFNFESSTNLDEVENVLRTAGFSIVEPTTDTGFGRQLQVSAPGGPLIKINELDRAQYAD